MRQVLVVDDDRAIRELLICALEYEGYVVATLHNGSGVLDALRAAAEPTLVLMDLMMPRVDGWAVCRALAAEPELLARHRLVLMSASRVEEETIPLEARAFIRKPFDLDALYRLLASVALTLAPVAASMPPAVATCG